MTLTARLLEDVSACFTGLRIQSHEHEDALTEIAQMCQGENWRLVVWDISDLEDAREAQRRDTVLAQLPA